MGKSNQEEFVPKDEVYLVGKDLGELSADSPYARIAFLRVDDDALGTGQKLYSCIRKIEYTRYHTNPDFPYDKLEAIMERSEQITTALDHLMRDVKMDCHTCSLKDVCEEVEELTKKDFDQE